MTDSQNVTSEEIESAIKLAAEIAALEGKLDDEKLSTMADQLHAQGQDKNSAAYTIVESYRTLNEIDRRSRQISWASGLLLAVVVILVGAAGYLRITDSLILASALVGGAASIVGVFLRNYVEKRTFKARDDLLNKVKLIAELRFDH